MPFKEYVIINQNMQYLVVQTTPFLFLTWVDDIEFATIFDDWEYADNIARGIPGAKLKPM